MITKENKHSVSDIMALMFKRTDLSNTEHYDSSHLKHKSKLFRTQVAEIAKRTAGAPKLAVDLKDPTAIAKAQSDVLNSLRCKPCVVLVFELKETYY